MYISNKKEEENTSKNNSLVHSKDGLPIKESSRSSNYHNFGLSDSQIKKKLLSKSQYNKYMKESSRGKYKLKEGVLSASNLKMVNSSLRNQTSSKSPSKLISNSNRNEAKSVKLGLSKSIKIII